MLKTRIMIYMLDGVIQSIETPDDPDSLEVVIRDVKILRADRPVKIFYPAGVAPADEEDWNAYKAHLKKEGQ